MNKEYEVLESESDACPYCASKKIDKEGIKVGTIAKESSKLIPRFEGYNCSDCGKYFHKRIE